MSSLLRIGIVGGIAYGIYWLFGLKRASDEIVTRLSNPRIHTVDMRGIVIRTEVNVSNPTKTTVKITKPVVTLTTKGKYITSTNPENKEIAIRPLATSMIDTIELVIPWTILAGYVVNIIGKVPQIIAAFKAKDMTGIAAALSIPLEMKYSLYADGLAFESTPEKIL
jgi:hypothetical protein